MATSNSQSERNRRYYEANRDKEKARKLAHYHATKDKIDRDAKKAYMAEYLKTYERKPNTPEQLAEKNRKRREQYATDPAHRARMQQEVKAWQQANPEKRKAQRLRQFKLTLDQFNAMLESQGGGCAICGHADRSDPKFFPVVDHCHTTGKVRGLLCMHCNQGLGKYMDQPARLIAAAEYLTRSSSGATSTPSKTPSSEPSPSED
jgi:hypothetical protein